jgi:hypothetical protein
MRKSGLLSVRHSVLSSARRSFIVDRAGRLQHQRFVQIPEQLAELAHDREHVEHLLCGSRVAQSCPPKVTWQTFWPAPKQSYTVQPGKPCCLRLW